MLLMPFDKLRQLFCRTSQLWFSQGLGMLRAVSENPGPQHCVEADSRTLRRFSGLIRFKFQFPDGPFFRELSCIANVMRCAF
jgi:hypothetical protein